MLAVDLLRSGLVGMEVLFDRLDLDWWLINTRRVLDLPDPAAMAIGYGLMSQGSAPGTFYDLLITRSNGHHVTEDQEPWVNHLLLTFQAVAAVATEAIASQGAAAAMPVPTTLAARRYPWHTDTDPGAADRSRMIVYSVICTTCASRFLLDTAVVEAAACRWSLSIAPPMIEADLSPDLVTTALDPDHDAAARHAVEAVRPAADALGLVAVRRPYNRPSGQADDRCRVCGADTWTAGPLLLQEDPIRFVPLS
jgi:hypothetical protein